MLDNNFLVLFLVILVVIVALVWTFRGGFNGNFQAGFSGNFSGGYKSRFGLSGGDSTVIRTSLLPEYKKVLNTLRSELSMINNIATEAVVNQYQIAINNTENTIQSLQSLADKYDSVAYQKFIKTIQPAVSKMIDAARSSGEKFLKSYYPEDIKGSIDLMERLTYQPQTKAALLQEANEIKTLSGTPEYKNKLQQWQRRVTTYVRNHAQYAVKERNIQESSRQLQTTMARDKFTEAKAKGKYLRADYEKYNSEVENLIGQLNRVQDNIKQDSDFAVIDAAQDQVQQIEREFLALKKDFIARGSENQSALILEQKQREIEALNLRIGELTRVNADQKATIVDLRARLERTLQQKRDCEEELSQIKARNRELMEQQRAREGQQGEIDELRGRLTACEEKSASLQKQLSARDLEIRELRDELDLCQERNAKLLEQIQELESAKVAASQSLESEMELDRLRQELAASQARIQELNKSAQLGGKGVIEELRQKITELTQGKDAVEARMMESQQKHAAEIQELTAQINAEQERIPELERRIRELDTTNMELNLQIAEQRLKRAENVGTGVDLLLINQKLKKQLEAARKEIDKLARQLEVSEDVRVAFVGQVDILQQKLRDCYEESEKFNRQLQEQFDKTRSKTREVYELQKQLEESQASIERLQQLVADAKFELQNYKSDDSRLNDLMRQLQAEKDRNAQLDAEKTNALSLYFDLLKSSTERSQSDRIKINAERSAKDKCIKALQELTAVNKKLQDLVKKLQQDSGKATDQRIRELEARIAALEKELAEKQEELTVHKNAVDLLAAENVELQRQLQDCQAALRDCEAEKAEMRTRMQRMGLAHDKLQERLRQVQAETSAEDLARLQAMWRIYEEIGDADRDADRDDDDDEPEVDFDDLDLDEALTPGRVLEDLLARRIGNSVDPRVLNNILRRFIMNYRREYPQDDSSGVQPEVLQIKKIVNPRPEPPNWKENMTALVIEVERILTRFRKGLQFPDDDIITRRTNLPMHIRVTVNKNFGKLKNIFHYSAILDEPFLQY